MCCDFDFSLQELHLSMNRYYTVNIPDNYHHTSLSRLFMNDSNIENWEDICKLGRAFPSIESLTVINSNIKCLADCEQYSEFSHLTCLNISHCCLTCWNDVDRFRKFPVLDHLRISGVPFLEVRVKRV